jgi:membrane-associated phospholipid phosphatase
MKPTRTLVILLLVALSAGLTFFAFQNDTRVRDAIVTAQGKGWKKTPEAATIRAISKYGDWPQLMLAAVVGILLAWRFRRPEWTRILVACMIASTLAGMLANTSRLTTGRTRPRDEKKVGVGFHGPIHEGKLTIGNSKMNAFPSGHTATAVGFAGVLLFARPLVGLVALALALLIAWSRLALGAHHISDVTVSIILALAVAWFVWRAAKKHGDKVTTWIRKKLSRQ